MVCSRRLGHVAIDPLTSQGIVTSMKTGSFVGDMIAEGLLIWSGKPLLLKLAAEFEAWSKLKDEGADASVDRS
ncbi:hypothetical protein K435DRAFT_520817 [Dendrothele bispora CBS 962.96]|uniref:Uncharacterized protein n=1 Tax=Dendrothele bispora (strain CBS 962.96) TaxID=1314807 RepID=A0A4S8KVA0_DENBC|nr:hypothetical protein K435DRAFT_520817 [Dendrothele bispora CBS 962.96]